MEITVEGWARNHGTRTLAKRDLSKAKLGGQVNFLDVAANVVVHDPKNASENIVDVYFHTKLTGNSDYLANLYFSFEDIDRLYALALVRRDPAEAVKSLSRFL